MSVYELNPALDVDALARRFATKKRLQIENFFPIDVAEALENALRGTEWRTVLNEGSKHFDIHPVQIEALGADKLKLITDAAKKRGRVQFQYLYENYPIADARQSGNLTDPIFIKLFETMNSSSVLGALQRVTGLEIDFCDMQPPALERGIFSTIMMMLLQVRIDSLPMCWVYQEAGKRNGEASLSFLTRRRQKSIVSIQSSIHCLFSKCRFFIR